MWQGDQQSGGQQNPQGPPTPPQQPPGVPGGYGQPNPYAQPGPSAPSSPPPPPPSYAAPTQPYGTPAQSPYAQPGYQQPGSQPSGYQQPGYQQQSPGGYGTPQPWGPPAPGGPQGPPPGKDRNTTTIAIAVTAAVAVIAAVVVGAVYFTGGKKKDDAKDSPSPSTSAPRSPTATPTTAAPTDTATDPSADGGDNPRGTPVDYKPVIPGWKVVRRDERNVLFDVPPDWTVDSQGMTIGFSDKSGNPAVAMSGPAYYKHDFCSSGGSTYDRAAVGTKGAKGATSVRNAAEVQAKSWAYWAYQDNGKGTFSNVLDSKAFHNSHGISGWEARATASNIPTPNKCSSPGGEAWTVAWLNPAQTDPSEKLVVWVLYADRGVSNQLAESVVEQIKSSIRFEK